MAAAAAEAEESEQVDEQVDGIDAAIAEAEEEAGAGEGDDAEGENLEEALQDGVDEEELEQLEAQLAEGEDEGPGDEGAVDENPPSEEDDDDHLQGVEVEEHLIDAVEGSLRLKRMLSRDEEEDGPSAKKQKLSPEAEAKKMKVQKLVVKWGLQTDATVRHVCETCSVEELDTMLKSSYVPDKFNQWKPPSEMLARYLCDLRERHMPGGAMCDAIAAFKHRFRMDMSKDKLLRSLSHKDLRYVLTYYDGSQELEDLVREAAVIDAVDDNTTATALPDAKGVIALGRFQRLELIDPLADAAVFGDANLTFAINLAKHREALGHVGRVIATTFEDLDTLRERYKEIDESISTLEEYTALVYHCVDCTRIAIDERFKTMQGSFGAVYYNFPHSGAIQGFFDGHPIVNWRHENLMRLFFRALRSFVKPGGCVKVASNMGAVGVRYSYIIGSAMENEFVHVETVPFMEWHLHRYGRSYGDKRDIHRRPDAKNNQSYNAQAAERDMVYCFAYAPSGDMLGTQHIRMPPTLKTLKHCRDGPFKNLQGTARERLAQQLHHRFVTEVSGTHVG